MRHAQYFDDEAFDAGLPASDVQSMARRQLVASAIVALVIAAITGLTALKPAQPAASDLAPLHKAMLIQAPAFVTAASPAGVRKG